MRERKKKKQNMCSDKSQKHLNEIKRRIRTEEKKMEEERKKRKVREGNEDMKMIW